MDTVASNVQVGLPVTVLLMEFTKNCDVLQLEKETASQLPIANTVNDADFLHALVGQDTRLVQNFFQHRFEIIWSMQLQRAFHLCMNDTVQGIDVLVGVATLKKIHFAPANH